MALPNLRQAIDNRSFSLYDTSRDRDLRDDWREKRRLLIRLPMKMPRPINSRQHNLVRK
jgi:hypothetical protein